MKRIAVRLSPVVLALATAAYVSRGMNPQAFVILFLICWLLFGMVVSGIINNEDD